MEHDWQFDVGQVGSQSGHERGAPFARNASILAQEVVSREGLEPSTS